MDDSFGDGNFSFSLSIDTVLADIKANEKRRLRRRRRIQKRTKKNHHQTLRMSKNKPVIPNQLLFAVDDSSGFFSLSLSRFLSFPFIRPALWNCMCISARAHTRDFFFAVCDECKNITMVHWFRNPLQILSARWSFIYLIGRFYANEPNRSGPYILHFKFGTLPVTIWTE